MDSTFYVMTAMSEQCGKARQRERQRKRGRERERVCESESDRLLVPVSAAFSSFLVSELCEHLVTSGRVRVRVPVLGTCS